jgi:hypothetical protein
MPIQRPIAPTRSQQDPAILRLEFEEGTYPLLLSLSSLLYDIELAHDLSVMLAYPEYAESSLATPFFFYRKGRPLHLEHRARAARISKQSPLTIEVVIAALGGVWILVQIIDKVSNWSLNREKLQLEVEKLRYEREIKRLERTEKYEERLRRRNAVRLQEQLVQRLGRSEFRLIDASIHTPESLPQADQGPRDRSR